MGQHAPWEGVAAKDQLFVLITGANSGVGLAFCYRLIDEFLASRPASAHLILVPTTRSVTKSRQTILSIRKHLSRVATAVAAAVLDRVHLGSLQLDLCNVETVHATARRLLSGSVDLYPHADDAGRPVPARIPRLDAVVFNAAWGGFVGVNWWRFVPALLAHGIINSLTWPTYKTYREVTVVNRRAEVTRACDASPDEPVLGQVFCANVFGHYLLAHKLMPLLSRRGGGEGERERERGDDGAPPGRIVWVSSIEGVADFFRPDDVQGLRSLATYDSSKRLTDVLGLTSDLPAVRAHTASYFAIDDAELAAELTVKPRIYVTHPGIVPSTLFPLLWILFPFYRMCMYVVRWLGSPWHPVSPYKGACAIVWAVLESQAALDDADAHHVKWGSSCSRFGHAGIKKTEVDGWGWEGRVEDRDALAADPATGVLRKMAGRRAGAMGPTVESIQDFEMQGAECWREMETIRRKWEDLLVVKEKKEEAKEAKEAKEVTGMAW